MGMFSIFLWSQNVCRNTFSWSYAKSFLVWLKAVGGDVTAKDPAFLSLNFCFESSTLLNTLSSTHFLCLLPCGCVGLQKGSLTTLGLEGIVQRSLKERETPDYSAGLVTFGLKSYSCRLISCCIKGRVGAPAALQLKAVTNGSLYVWTVCFFYPWIILKQNDANTGWHLRALALQYPLLLGWW